MGRVSGYLMHGVQHVNKYFVSETLPDAGVLVGATADGGVANPTGATARADCYGLALDVATYSTTPAAGATGIINVDIRPDQILNFKMSNGAAEDTALTVLTNTASSVTVCTSADVGTDDIDGGWLWRLQSEGEEAPLSEQRAITGYSSATSLTVTVGFESAMAVGDRMLSCPYANAGLGADGTDGNTNASFSTLFTQVDTTTASGTGYVIMTYRIIARSDVDSELEFLTSVERMFMSGLNPS